MHDCPVIANDTPSEEKAQEVKDEDSGRDFIWRWESMSQKDTVEEDKVASRSLFT